MRESHATGDTRMFSPAIIRAAAAQHQHIRRPVRALRLTFRWHIAVFLWEVGRLYWFIIALIKGRPILS